MVSYTSYSRASINRCFTSRYWLIPYRRHMAFNKAWCRSDTVHWYLCRCFLSHRAWRSRRNAAFVVAERAIIFRTVLSSILPPEAGPDGRSQGERRPPGRRDLPSSRNLFVLDTRTSVPHSADTVQILGQIFQRWDAWAAGGGARGAVGPLIWALLSRAAGAGHRRTADAGLSRLRPRHPARVVRAALARRNPPTSFVIRLQPWRLTAPPAGAAERVLCMGRATPHRLLHRRRSSGPGSVATPGLYVGPG